MMGPQSEGRPSTDRRPGDTGYNNRGAYRQQSSEDNQDLQPQRTNGYGQADTPKQRYMAPPPATGDPRSPNGSLPHSPVDGRNDRSRDRTQDLPVRERSRPNGAPGGKSSGAPRICKKCGEALTGQFVRALGGTFHLDCFRCRVGRSSPLKAPADAGFRIAQTLSPQSSSLSIMRKVRVSTHSARLTTFVDLIYCVTSVEGLCVVPI